MKDEQLAQGLGWFSVGLGLTELLAPRRVAQMIGVNGHEKLIRAYGARELASGIGILSGRTQTGLWSRVAGDMMDLSTLGAAFTSETTNKRKLAAAITAVAGVTALDVLASTRYSKAQSNGSNGASALDDGAPESKGISVKKSITINRPREEIFTFWQNLENLPTFMSHLKSVVVEGNRSHWVAKGPFNTDVEWDAEMAEEIPNELISWRSLPGATVDNAGTVEFETATGNRGTVVRVELKYNPPGGVVGATIAKILGESPEKQIPVDLMHLRQLLETGEIATTEGQSAGRAHSTSRIFDDWLRK